MMDEEFLERQFFVFDSDNLESITEKFYGYGFIENEIVFDNSPLDFGKLSRNGAFVYVNVDDINIKISQDYVGSYGLYYYQDKDYFAISNSFLKLMEYLRDNNKKITFNRDYADYYLGIKLCSNVYSCTLINEIEMLSKDIDVIIDKQAKTIEFKDLNVKEHYIPINSKQALDILDDWFYRWVEILRNIRKSTNNIFLDLSGGMDSRMVSLLWLNANIDLENIKITSSIGPKFEEDFEIASEIANEFNFNLNHNISFMKNPISSKTSIVRSEYVKFGFEKQRFIRNNEAVEPIFRISGYCGGTLRNHINQNPDEYIKSMLKVSDYLSPELNKSTKLILEDEFDKLSEKYNVENRNDNQLPLMLYNIARNRHHFGKDFVDSFMFNKITIAPLSDGELQKIDYQIGIDDDLLLIALIFKRFAPELLDFKFDSNRSINQETIDACDEINQISPFKPREYEFIDGPDVEKITQPNLNKTNDSDRFRMMREVFNSLEFEREFEKYYSKSIYNKFRLNFSKYRTNHYDIYAAIEIIKTISDVNAANRHDNKDFVEWLDSYDLEETVSDNDVKSSYLLDKYSIARIDIKNVGEKDNSIEIIANSDNNSNVDFPNWFSTDKGKGCVITSKNMTLNLKIKAIGDGELVIKLKSSNIKDKNNSRFPVYIDYNKFSVDGDEILSSNKLVSHDSPWVFKMDVKDSQVIDLDMDWLPFSKESIYENSKVQDLESKIKSLEKENSILKSQLSQNSSSTYSKLMSKLNRI